VIPNAVRAPESLPEPAPRHDLVFVGNLSYRPNVDAARWLCEKVVPLLGDATVALVGSRPAPDVRALAATPGVTLAADVSDVAPWYAGARLAVVPLHAGAGTRMKVLEALAHRRPVVATRVGSEGLELDGGVIVADSEDEFAAACRRLLDDPALARRLAARGEASVRRTATVDVVAPQIDRLFRNILAG
jgi:glycosyltransferase involved in cell wall biosynthesis